MRRSVVRLGGPPAPTLRVEMLSSSLDGVPLDTLMAVARRDNPKRALLVVSKVLAKHLNAAPRTAVAAGAALGQVVATALGSTSRTGASEALADALITGQAPKAVVPAADQGPEATVIAAAETATAIGHLVRRELGPGPLLHTTRTLAPEGALLSFSEPHSHAVEHHLFHDDAGILKQTAPVVIVDDELTTGRTAMNTIAAIQRVAPRERYLIATYLDLRPSTDRDELARFAGENGLDVEVVSLLSATTAVDDGELVMPSRVSDAGASSGTPKPPGTVALRIGARPTARRGWTEREQSNVETMAGSAASMLEPLRSGPRALVLGTEELMFVPMIIAAHLTGDVAMRSTTRSPILVSPEPGYPIVDGVTYAATDGTQGSRYLYNLDLDEVDDVFLFCAAHDQEAYRRRSRLLRALTMRHEQVHVVAVAP